MKSIFYSIAFVMLALTMPIQAQAQLEPLSVSYQTVAGPSFDTVKVYFRNNTGATMLIGSLNLSFVYESSATNFVGTADDIFEAEWGATFKFSGVQNFAREYAGTAYDRRWQYGNTSPSIFSPTTVEIPADGLAILGMKLIFENSGSLTNPYLELQSENFGNDITDEFGTNIDWDRESFGNGTFPVEWLSFDAYAIGAQTAQLTWRTATETQNDRFVIERSTDGQTFGEVGAVKGAGTTQELQRYTFVDEKVLATVAYYRLRQIDMDGNETYSEQREVRFGDRFQANLSMYPNPTTDYVEVEGLALGESFRVFFTDVAGREVLRAENLLSEQGIIRLDLIALPAGLYTLTAENARTGHQQSAMLRYRIIAPALDEQEQMWHFAA